jgi:sporulation protein YlmC with PRC-barrel domain
LTANQWQALWTIVQWQDGLDDWQDVEGWQGTLDEVSDNVGKKVWWVAEASFGKGPFRWVIYQQQAGTWLATSEPFYLPTVGGETVKVEVVLVPPVAAVKSPPTAEAPGAYVSAPGNATAGTERRHGGNWAANRYTAHTAGNWTIRGSFKGHTADVVLTVNIGELSEIVISPDTATVTAGNAQAYTAQAFDAYGNLLGDVTANTNFSVVEEGHGGSWAANRYLAHTAGTWTVRGTYRGLTNDAKLNVKPGELSYIVITPKTAVVNAGNEIAFTAEAFDAYDNSLGDVSDDTTFTIVESKYGD